MDIAQVFMESAKGGWELYKGKWRALLPLMGLLFAAAVLMNLLGAMPNTSNLALVGGGFAIMLITALVTLVAGFATLNCINGMYIGKGRPAMGYFGENLAPAIKYALFGIAMLMVFAVVAVALVGALLIGSGAALPNLANLQGGEAAIAALSGVFLIALAVIVPLLLAYVVASFFIQFAQYEMAAGRKGLIEALKSSIELVKTNLLLVFINGILFAVLFIGIAIPYIILALIGSAISAVIAFGIYGAAALAKGAEPTLLSGIISLACALPSYAYLYAVQVPLQYAILVKYWRVLRGTDKI